MSARHSTQTDIMLSVGGVVGRLSLGAAPAAFLDQVAARYDAFRLPAADLTDRAFALQVTFMPAAAVRAEGRTGEIVAHPLRITNNARAGVMKGERWDFSFKLSHGTFRKRQRWAGQARCEMNPFALDSLLRVLWSTFLSRDGAALIHSAGLRQATRCFEVESRRESPAAEVMACVTPHATASRRATQPQSTREMISEFRSFLRKHKTYAFKPRGNSMRPWLKAGDSLFIQAA